VLPDGRMEGLPGDPSPDAGSCSGTQKTPNCITKHVPATATTQVSFVASIPILLVRFCLLLTTMHNFLQTMASWRRLPTSSRLMGNAELSVAERAGDVHYDLAGSSFLRGPGPLSSDDSLNRGRVYVLRKMITSAFCPFRINQFLPLAPVSNSIEALLDGAHFACRVSCGVLLMAAHCHFQTVAVIKFIAIIVFRRSSLNQAGWVDRRKAQIEALQYFSDKRQYYCRLALESSEKQGECDDYDLTARSESRTRAAQMVSFLLACRGDIATSPLSFIGIYVRTQRRVVCFAVFQTSQLARYSITGPGLLFLARTACTPLRQRVKDLTWLSSVA